MSSFESETVALDVLTLFPAASDMLGFDLLVGVEKLVFGVLLCSSSFIQRNVKVDKAAEPQCLACSKSR